MTCNLYVMMAAPPVLVRSGRAAASAVFVPVSPARGRPRVEFRARVRSRADAEEARRANVPLFVLTREMVAGLGYPVNLPDLLLVAESIRGAIDSTLAVIPFVSEDAVRDPRVEDVIVALLRVNPLIARVLLERNRSDVQSEYLLKRVLVESVERLATRVRFQDVVPTIPVVGDALSQAAISHELARDLRPTAVP
jgi:hypothetical protein